MKNTILPCTEVNFKAPHLPSLRLTRESSTNDNVVVLWVSIRTKCPSGVLERQSHLCPLRIEGGRERAAGSEGEETRLDFFQKEWEQDTGVLSACQCPGSAAGLFLICPSVSSHTESYEHSRCSVNVCKLTSAKMPPALVTSVSSLCPQGLLN